MIDVLYDPPERQQNKQTKPFKWILIDSAIVGAFMFVAALPYDHPPTWGELYIALRAFAYFFLFEVMLERGIKPLWLKKRLEQSTE